MLGDFQRQAITSVYNSKKTFLPCDKHKQRLGDILHMPSSHYALCLRLAYLQVPTKKIQPQAQAYFTPAPTRFCLCLCFELMVEASVETTRAKMDKMVEASSHKWEPGSVNSCTTQSAQVPNKKKITEFILQNIKKK